MWEQFQNAAPFIICLPVLRKSVPGWSFEGAYILLGGGVWSVVGEVFWAGSGWIVWEG
jgi:hypothetical protein